MIDILMAITLLCLFSPFLLVLCVVLYLYNDSRIFFVQKRPGKDEKPFLLYKFRTMKDDDEDGGEEKVTPIGRLLRKTSLNEFPQMINVLKGEMSIVGPRPLLMEYLPFYSDYQRNRHNVLPGITGWAQVNGRNLLTWQQKFKYDIYYVNNLSFWLDLKIIFLTIFTVISTKGVNTKSGSLMQKFVGNND